MSARGAPLIIHSADGDGIRFVEDESSSEYDPLVGPITTSSAIPPESAQFLEIPPKDQTTLQRPLSLSRSPTTVVDQDSKTPNVVLTILPHSPSLKRKKYVEYDLLSVGANHTYSSIPDRPNGEKASKKEEKPPENPPSEGFSGWRGSIRRRAEAIGVGGADSRKQEIKVDEEEQILEALRQVVRKCTSPDPLKRPSSIDVLDSLSEKS